MFSTLLAACAALPCVSAVPPLQDVRQVEVRMEAPDGTVIPPSKRSNALHGRLVIEDGTGWPLKVDVWPRDNTETAHVFSVPVGSTLEFAAYLAPYPVGEQQIFVRPGQGAQASTLRLAEPVEMRSLRIDCVPEASVSYHDYYLNVLSPDLGIPFLFCMADEIRRGVSLPADTYTVLAAGHYMKECGNGAPEQADFLAHRTKVDLRTEPKAIRIRPKGGELLRFRVTNPGIHGSKTLASFRNPHIEALIELESPWARIRLVNVASGQAMEPEWGWRSLPYVIPQAGFPLDTDVYTTDRIAPGTYDVLLRGRRIQSLKRRILVKAGANDPIVLAPNAR